MAEIAGALAETKTPARSRRTAVPAPTKPAASAALDTLTAGATSGRGAKMDMATTALHPHPANPAHRSERGFEDLAEQIRAEGGIRVPLEVRSVGEGQHEVLSGSRRLAAARYLGTLLVPVVVRDDVDDAAALRRVLADNLNRLDFTESEQADLVQGLLDLNLTPAAIAEQLGKGKEWVARRRAIAKLPSTARAVVDVQPDLDLVVAAKLAEFADDPEALDELVKIAHDAPDTLDQHATRRRVDRAVAERTTSECAAFTDLGYTLLDRHVYDGDTRPLHSLSASAGGRELAPVEHEDCPGRAVMIKIYPLLDTDGTVAFNINHTHFCTAWKTAGHYNRYAETSSGATSGPKSDEEKAQLAHTKETNKASATAAIERRRWLEEYFAGPFNHADTMAYVAHIFTLGAGCSYMPNPHLAWAYLNPADHGSTVVNLSRPVPTSLAHKRVVALAVSIAEKAMEPKDYWRSTWSADLFGRHLQQLADWGYLLAPHEQTIVDAWAERAAKAVA